MLTATKDKVTLLTQASFGKTKRRVMNIVFIISASLALISGAMGIDSRPYALSLVFLAFVFTFTLFLNNVLRKNAFTEYFITFSTTTWIIYMCIAFPSTLGEQNYLIIALVALAIFSKKPLYRTISIAVLIGLSVFLNLYQKYYPPLFAAPKAETVLFAINVAMPLTIIAVMCLWVLKDTAANQATIEQQRLKLEESNQFKDKVFSVVSHDMRSPIASTLGILEILETDDLSSEERANVVKELRRDLTATLHTLDNILGWASQGYYASILNTKTNLEPLRVSHLIGSALPFLKPAATQKNIRFIEEVPQDLFVRGDLQQIQFVLRNITGNAIKFSNLNQTITFRATAVDKHVIISVIDEGIGMTAEMVSSLFNVTTRFSREGTTSEKGTGLGLIFCKEFIENNHGKIWVESEPEKGTTFHFSFEHIQPANFNGGPFPIN